MGFLESQPRCQVAMEACGSAHYWGREIGELGHEVKIMPPRYVKAYVKRQKNDASDAEAICEAAILAFAPPMASFRNGRDFSAWLGLVPWQHSTGARRAWGGCRR